MQILILGGTRFLGRHFVASALARGHAVTLFNRGQSAPGLFSNVETLIGDRDDGLGSLRGRRWDAVIDTCGYVPRIVRDSARLLSDSAGFYLFISSISVYPDITNEVDESSAVGTLADESVEAVTGETYGPLKALCERQVEAAFPGRSLNVRAGLIVGPHDPTDRFTYWPCRIAGGGEVLVPRGAAGVQFVDARDLAEWGLRMIESRTAGVYNATGPAEILTMGDFLFQCRGILASDADLIEVPDEFLLEQKIEPWMGLPMWIPGGDLRARCGKAIAAGLAFRPLAETLRDTVAWASTRSADWKWRAGISRAREAEVLQAWRDRLQRPRAES